jgi:hypothetical protein
MIGSVSLPLDRMPEDVLDFLLGGLHSGSLQLPEGGVVSTTVRAGDHLIVAEIVFPEKLLAASRAFEGDVDVVTHDRSPADEIRKLRP